MSLGLSLPTTAISYSDEPWQRKLLALGVQPGAILTEKRREFRNPARMAKMFMLPM